MVETTKVSVTEGNPLFGTGGMKCPAAGTACPVNCRAGCGACCIAPSISSLGKPAGEPCRHLTAELNCAIFGQPERPACCSGLQASAEMCGATREQALAWLTVLEQATA